MSANPESVIAYLEQERVDAAVARLHRAKLRLESLNAESPYEKFPTELRLLQEALDLLDPKVKFA